MMATASDPVVPAGSRGFVARHPVAAFLLLLFGIGVLVSCYHAAAACRVPLRAEQPVATVYRQLWIAGLVGLFGLATPTKPPSAAAAPTPVRVA